MKYQLGRKIMAKCFGLIPKTYNYLTDDGSVDEKAKGTKRCHKKKTSV